MARDVAVDSDGDQEDLARWVATLHPIARRIWAGNNAEALELIRRVEEDEQVAA